MLTDEGFRIFEFYILSQNWSTAVGEVVINFGVSNLVSRFNASEFGVTGAMIEILLVLEASHRLPDHQIRKTIVLFHFNNSLHEEEDASVVKFVQTSSYRPTCTALMK